DRRKKQHEGKSALWFKEFDLYIGASFWLEIVLILIGSQIKAINEFASRDSKQIGTAGILLVVGIAILPLLLVLVSLQFKWTAYAKAQLQKAQQQIREESIETSPMSKKRAFFLLGTLFLYFLAFMALVLDFSWHFVNPGVIIFIICVLLAVSDLSQGIRNWTRRPHRFFRSIVFVLMLLFVLEFLLQLIHIHISDSISGSMSTIAFFVLLFSSFPTLTGSSEAQPEQDDQKHADTNGTIEQHV
ncbi:MAG: hypothetical protein M3Z08_24750, partial [Chloroflexota bacterium]|nr:hypothetical protein [Chloroflexota bacterium]